MSKFRTYTDDRCVITRQDPRFDPLTGRITATVTRTHLQVRDSEGETIMWPLSAIEEIEVGIVGPDADGVRIVVTDPEGVLHAGFQVEITCRNDYFAGVLAYRLGDAASIPPTETNESYWDREWPF